VLLSSPIGIAASSQSVPTEQDNLIGDVPGLIETAKAGGIGPVGAESGNTFLYTFTRAGQFRESLVLLPGAVFETALTEIGAGRCISLVAAIPYNLGDGAVLEISVEGGSEQPKVVRVFLDPAHVRAHRTWVPIRLDIPADHDRVRLRFEVDPGIRGDQTGDWMGLAAGNDAGCIFAGP